jgi:ribosomal protein L16/L10AE
MDNGWIKLYRKSIDSRVFQNEGLWKVWTWCLLKANHKEQWVSITTGKGTNEILVKPGQFIFGRKTAAKELRMAESSVRNRIEKLKNTQKLDIKTDTHCSIISIINWESYQTEEIREDTQKDRQRTGKGQAKDTNKNVKNDKEKDTFEIESLFDDFWEHAPSRNGKKVDKPSARKKFIALKKDDMPLVVEAVKNYANSEMVKRGIGIKDPHRFLS